ncbi:hypothetical protein CRM22_001166 [Opisthorchis felineus]|uniref:Uncharacterized protein n=1 Tax=Opisthorchis felineus TaxID=147828 RepID=A0A4S2MG24_OPIFE|nr:hypothetical protein CRM22_001166 [Opisthorchis felineus]
MEAAVPKLVSNKSVGTLTDNITENQLKTLYTSPAGETSDGDFFTCHEQNPNSVSSDVPAGPYLSDENENWEPDLPCPESLATSIIYGDTDEYKIIGRSPHITDDSVLPVLVRTLRQPTLNDSVHVQAPSKVSCLPKRMADEESVQFTSSTSLVTDDYVKTQEPVKAEVHVHRRKKLEWKLQPTSEPLTSEPRWRGSRNSWTVYDDLLEDLEDSLCPVESHTHDQSSTGLDPSESFNGLDLPASKRMCEIIEDYLQRKFLNFSGRLDRDTDYPNSTKICSEIATMTDAEEKDDEEDESWFANRRSQCLPVCRCVPKRTISKRY